MKLPHVFTKTPNHKRFNFQPRHYDPVAEERKEREAAIRRELELKGTSNPEAVDEVAGYRNRIQGSFRKAKKTVDPQRDPSVNMLRLISLLAVTLVLFSMLQWGRQGLIISSLVFVPIYFYFRFRRRPN